MDAVSFFEKYKTGESDPTRELEHVISKLSTEDSIFISTDLDRAYREAKAATERWRHNMALSMFDGVPIAWKDLFDVAGSVTTAGSKTRINLLKAERDAETVARLTRMGLVNIGKTNLTEFAYSGLGLNPHFGTPKNSINPIRIPGGSSSGAAVAVGNNIVPLSMGTDTAGSIRIPAAFNGLIGFRPSANRYSKQGVFPLANSLDTTGPITRSVRDCYVLDQLIFGKRVESLPVDLMPEDLHVVVDWDVLNHPNIQNEVKVNFENAVNVLKNKGVRVSFEKVTAFAQALALIDQGRWLGAAEAYTLHQNLLNSDEAGLLDQRIRARLESAKGILASSQVDLYQQRDVLKKLLEKELSGRILLTPTVAHSAPELRPLEQDDNLFFEMNIRTLRLTMPGSFLDMPSVTMPNGLDKKGLPTGLLIAGACGEDKNVLSGAMIIEKLLADYSS